MQNIQALKKILIMHNYFNKQINYFEAMPGHYI